MYLLCLFSLPLLPSLNFNFFFTSHILYLHFRLSHFISYKNSYSTLLHSAQRHYSFKDERNMYKYKEKEKKNKKKTKTTKKKEKRKITSFQGSFLNGYIIYCIFIYLLYYSIFSFNLIFGNILSESADTGDGAGSFAKLQITKMSV